MTMKQGEVARITCTPDYGYGAGGFPAWGVCCTVVNPSPLLLLMARRTVPTLDPAEPGISD
jgi:hypothetical protein